MIQINLKYCPRFGGDDLWNKEMIALCEDEGGKFIYYTSYETPEDNGGFVRPVQSVYHEFIEFEDENLAVVFKLKWYEG